MWERKIESNENNRVLKVQSSTDNEQCGCLEEECFTQSVRS